VIRHEHVDVLGEADGDQQRRDDRGEQVHGHAEVGHRPQGPHDAQESRRRRDHHALGRAEGEEQDEEEHRHADGDDGPLVVVEVALVGDPRQDLADLVDGEPGGRTWRMSDSTPSVNRSLKAPSRGRESV
jgi:hypothetical protein